MNKTTRIPNLFPEKSQLLEEQENQKHFEALLKAQKKNEITKEDIDRLVVESEDYKVVKQRIEQYDDMNKKVSKSEFKRILNQMISSSDVCIQVVDARDPFNFRSKELENNIIKNKKKLIILLNKVDLVTKENVDKWQKLYRRNYPTLLFSSKELNEKTPEEIITHPYYTELIETIRKITENEHKKITISLLGYPNMGKQSIINLIKNLNFKAFKSSADGLYEVKKFKYFYKY